MQLYKSLAASLFKEWEESHKLKKIDEERKSLSEMSFGSILKRDLQKITEMSMIKEVKKVMSTGYFMVN